jgi:N-acetyl-anhydromuramyl-L-alanine amidase AmpD
MTAPAGRSLNGVFAAALSVLALAAPATVARPPIAWHPIPYPASRRQEMAAYAQRHYGIRTSRLRNPRVIVEHMTAGPSLMSAWWTFAPDRPDGELHELPGVCSHFIIDTNGSVHQLVPLGTMCRHTVGLNWTAIGIEHVGATGEQTLANPRQRSASLRLTNWLRCRFGISVRNVIGHNESLSSPYHHERVARLRTQTHGDWPEAPMRRYRAALRRMAC